MSLGDLIEARFSDKLGPLEAAKIHIMGYDVSRALNYLHNEALLMHGDMKSFNVLIKGDFAVCKLCDFGVSIPIKADGLIDFEKKPAAVYVGTELWNAPEVFEEDVELISTKSEIFSFGLVLYECISLCPPHTLEMVNVNSKKVLDFNACENDDDEDDEDNELDYMVGTRPLFAYDMNLSESYDDILQIFYICTDDNPENRPDAKKLESIFQELKNV
jgi:PDZ-binding kinase